MILGHAIRPDSSDITKKSQDEGVINWRGNNSELIKPELKIREFKKYIYQIEQITTSRRVSKRRNFKKK